ncbi:MAG TPA: prolipoprotein diacylglyceryl transferase family protein [Polyangia bacterium]
MHPELVRLHYLGFERPIYSYGALVVVGIAVGIVVGVARAPRFGVARFDELAVGLLGVVGGLVGAALLFDVVQWRAIVADPTLLLRPGLVFYGGLFGGAAAAWAYCRAWRVPLLDAADAGAPGLALGHAIGRIGCLLGGCCYGRVVDAKFPLAVQLAGAWRHPVQLYEACGLVLIAIVTALLPRRRAGAILATYVAAYALLRLVVEHWRGDDLERGVVAHALSTSQLIALVVLAAGAALLYRIVSKKGAT